jgi:hypothetical protein
MGLTETILFYLLIGVSVAVATWMASTDARQRYFHTATAVLFWPLYLPILLTPNDRRQTRAVESPTPPTDELSHRIVAVERELDAAFTSLDGWAVDALTCERERIDELRTAWNSQSARIRAMDQLLTNSQVAWSADVEQSTTDDLIGHSERARRENFAKLHQVRNRAFTDLTTSLARVRELVSLIHLAKFTGAPGSRAEQLVIEIAASVEGLSEVAAWREPATNERECGV